MGQTLSYGVYLPNEGERNCYAGLASNWQILNTAVGNIAEKAPLVHTHGNISSDGKVGTNANMPLITGTGGAVQAGSFGNQANTFCEGNDSRLSDARTPVAHTHTKSDVTDLFNSANTWTDDNTFKSQDTNLALQSTVSELGSLTAASNWFRWIDKNGAQNAYISRDVWSSGADSLRIAIVGKRTNGAPSTSGAEIDCGVRLNLEADGTKSFTPFDTNINLGSSSNKWKTLNGINPGALSLPSSSYVVIDTTNWDLTGADNSYIPPEDGYLMCASNTCTDVRIFDFTTRIGATSHSSTSKDNYVYIHVYKNDNCIVGCVGTRPVARFYPCLGNV